MTPDQTKMILAKAALLDNRTVDLAVIKAWHQIIGHFDFADAMAALNLHRLESTEYLMPAHIKNNIPRAKAMNKTNEARQRAIEIAKEREVLGEHATPIEVAELRRSLNTALRTVDNPNQTPQNSLYERLKNSPEGRAAEARPNEHPAA